MCIRDRLIDSALERLQGLDRLVAGGSAEAAAGIVHAERSALRGSAAKRKASLHARRLLALAAPELEGEVGAEGEAAATNAALQQSADFYRHGEGRPGEPAFRAYNALNRLAIEALLLPAGAAPQAAIELARHCHLAAAEAYRRSASVWDAVMVPEACLLYTSRCV